MYSKLEKFFSNYEIKEWNETNFDFNCCDYVKEAYQAKRWECVSDYARFWILYRSCCVYFDTNAESIRPMDEILNRGAFMKFLESFDLFNKIFVAIILIVNIAVFMLALKKYGVRNCQLFPQAV